MHAETFKRLEYDKIKEQLATYAMNYLGRERIEKLEPYRERSVIVSLLQETEEAVAIIAHGASVPLPSLDGIEAIVTGFGKGIIFTAQDFLHVARFVESTQQLKTFMRKKATVAPRIASYADSLYELGELLADIRRCIRHGLIADEASSALGRIRKQIAIAEERTRKKLDAALSKYRSFLQEHVVGSRSGRYVLAVKKEHRKQVAGTVLDESASGQTVFVEPADIAELYYELSSLRAEEAAEVTKVLSALSDHLDSWSREITVNLEAVGHYDFVFAKAKYARSLEARSVSINTEGRIRIAGGRHPLLGGRMVPLDCRIGETFRALVITGPNTGGKTVALKTVGLLTLMAQSGLLVPVEAGSELAVFASVEADIGDGQSLEHSLSTFSSHIKNVVAILQAAGPSTLVLLDELATGTDPGEGIGLSIAVLEELHRRGATLLATTHFNEIKTFASATPGFENARMEFDADTLAPLYKLTIGEAGSSYAFFIALKLGMPQELVERSKFIASEASGRQDGIVLTGSAPQDQSGANNATGPVSAPRPKQLAGAGQEPAGFAIGDCVWVHSLKRTGIVSGGPDERGNFLVQIQKEKVRINRKRLSLYIERKQLYPGTDYDMDIVFESKDTRKKRKLMGKRHMEGLTIERKQEE